MTPGPLRRDSIFGVGMAVLGYCPGTGVAAIGDGSRHAIPGMIGAVFGAAAYAEAYPWVNAHILSVADMGKATLDSVTGLSPWWFMAGLVVAAAVGFATLERWEHGTPPTSTPSRSPSDAPITT